MDNDVWVVVLGIVSIIIGKLGESKKKKTNRESRQKKVVGREEPFDDNNNDIEQEIPDLPTLQPQNHIYSVPLEFKRVEPQTYTMNSDPDTKIDLDSQVNKAITLPKRMSNKSVKINLRQAIINKEILDRKYF